MKSFLTKTLSSKFISRSKTILIGTAIGQVITFASSLIITNYYGPEDLGLLGLLTALISVVAGTLTFRLDVSIIQETDEHAFKTFMQSTLFSMGASLVFCLICFALPFQFAKNISDHFLFFLLWTWGYFIFFNSKQLNYKFDHLTDTNLGTISRSVFLFVYYWLSGILKPTFGMLLSGRVLSDYVGSVFQLKRFARNIFQIKTYEFQWNSFFKKHKDYFFFMTPHHLCVALSNNLFIFFLETRFSLYEVGLFALAQRLIQAPIEMLGNTMAGVALKRFSEFKYQQEELKKFLMKIILFSSGIGVATGIVMYFSIDFFFSFLKPDWQDASTTVKCLIPYFIALIIMNPLTNYLRIINRAKLQLSLEVIEIGIKVTFLTFMTFHGSNEMVLGYGILTLCLVMMKSAVFFKTKPVAV